MKYSYDEEGVAFYYFIMTLAGLYVLPTTYRLLVPASQGSNHLVDVQPLLFRLFQGYRQVYLSPM